MRGIIPLLKNNDWRLAVGEYAISRAASTSVEMIQCERNSIDHQWLPDRVWRGSLAVYLRSTPFLEKQKKNKFPGAESFGEKVAIKALVVVVDGKAITKVPHKKTLSSSLNRRLFIM